MAERPRACSMSILVSASLLLLGAVPMLAADPAPRTYSCEGFAEPMNHPHLHIGRGRVLPLRVKLAAGDGTYGDDASVKTPPMLTLKFRPEKGPEVDKTAGMEVRDYGKGASFVFDKEAHWKFDLGTGNLPDDGKYVVTVVPGDAAEYKIDPTCTLEFQLEP